MGMRTWPRIRDLPAKDLNFFFWLKFDVITSIVRHEWQSEMGMRTWPRIRGLPAKDLNFFLG